MKKLISDFPNLVIARKLKSFEKREYVRIFTGRSLGNSTVPVIYLFLFYNFLHKAVINRK